MATITQRAFARKVYAAAQAVDIAPEFETAQAILESGWGKSAVGKYNLFGITKGSSWTGKTILVLTHGCSRFYHYYLEKPSLGVQET